MKAVLKVLLVFLVGSVLAQTHSGVGVVKKVDAAKGVVSLAHEPIKSLDWPAMTMNFSVRDKKALSALKPGQKITFELVDEKGRHVITAIK